MTDLADDIAELRTCDSRRWVRWFESSIRCGESAPMVCVCGAAVCSVHAPDHSHCKKPFVEPQRNEGDE